MWWNGYGWWWWWILFVVVFFLLPLGYGWGYRGWGPWYRRPPTVTTMGDGTAATGWGALGCLLWLALIVAIIWIFAALGWHGR